MTSYTQNVIDAENIQQKHCVANVPYNLNNNIHAKIVAEEPYVCQHNLKQHTAGSLTQLDFYNNYEAKWLQCGPSREGNSQLSFYSTNQCSQSHFHENTLALKYIRINMILY